MSFPTLTRKGKTSHIKQSSFDVAELAAAGRLNSTPDQYLSAERTSPLTPFKKISQFFRRHSSEPVPFAHSGSKSADKDHIFGRRLLDICTPELPKSISDLMLYLQDVGPFTREIFRKPPNAKKCGLLVEKLNTISGSVQWDVDESCNGLLLAAVFKTFLREIPHKVCDDRLYNQWTAIFQESRNTSDEQKVSQIKQLICKLPGGNQLLLKQTIAVLYRIQQRCLENQMNSYNLSVCLGPCLLWTTSTSCREVEKASKAVVSVTEFLINNCLEIFGRSILTVLRSSDNSLARKTSMSLDSIFTEKPKCYTNSHSMDALTDQLGRQLSPSRLSFDSGLILDDVSHDSEVTNDGKASEPIQKRLNLSYDSLDCDTYASDEEMTYVEHIAKLENNNTVYVNMPSQSSKAFSQGGKKLICQGSTNGCRNDYQCKASSENWCTRSSGLARSSTLRLPNNSETRCKRQQSVSYDRITYRYIPKPREAQTAEDRFYSLRRPQSQHTLSSAYYAQRRQSANPHRAELVSITCGQSEWKQAEVPMIVIDKCQSEPLPPVNHVTRIQIGSINPKSQDSPDCPRAEQSRLLNVTDAVEPIYENSELYGPSPNLPRPQNYITQTSPLYENLPFHRHQPISRSRSKNTTNSYSTYRQQTNRSRPSLLTVFEQRTGTLPRPPVYRQQPAQTMQETCYFV